MKMSVRDRRRAPRIPVEMKVKYKTIRGKNKKPGVSNSFELVTVQNMSEFGMCIVTKAPLEMNDIIRVEFKLDGRVINAFCEVVWVHERYENGEYEIGLEFDFLNDYDSILLIKYLHSILKEYGIL